MTTIRFRITAVLIGAALAVLIWMPASTQPVEFIREHVTLLISSESIVVEGIYLLRNSAPMDRIQSLTYPFPVDSTHTFPDSISVTYQQHPVEFAVKENRIVFSLEIPAGEQAGFRVVYRQPCLDNSACYILTSTSAWGQPLKSADFVIVFAEGLLLDWVSYEVTEDENRACTYTFSRNDFSPDRDLCLRWRRRASTDTSP
jgi:hypothetical protein